jgi:hypothetical protein
LRGGCKAADFFAANIVPKIKNKDGLLSVDLKNLRALCVEKKLLIEAEHCF